jgi:hypothetical protein
MVAYESVSALMAAYESTVRLTWYLAQLPRASMAVYKSMARKGSAAAPKPTSGLLVASKPERRSGNLTNSMRSLQSESMD